MCDDRVVSSTRAAPRTTRLRMVVIDDHALFTRGLALLMGPASKGAVEVVGTTSNPRDAEELVASASADVAIVDLSMPGRDGLEVVAALRRRFEDLRIMVVSGTDDLTRVRAVLAAGADGFMPKTSDPTELMAPLLALAEGWSVLPRNVLIALIERPPSRPGLPTSITPAQTALLRLLATGAELKQIAGQLMVSERTAKRQIAALLDHLGVTSRIEAVALAGQTGLLDDG
jgi:two-component system, NarL family, nitrate/nitrite response regulator NarL